MDPLKYQQLTLPTVEVFLKIEEQILINIARKLKRNKKMLNENIESWQLTKLNQLGALTQENIIIIAKHAGLAIDEVSEMLKKAGYGAVNEHETDLIEAVRMGLLAQPSKIAESTALLAVLEAYEEQAKQWINLVSTTLLAQSRQVYLDIVNQVTGKVLTGVSTPQEALRETAARWAKNGVPALIDKAGRQWSTEAYINMVTRSMSNNIANHMQDARMDEYGVDLIEISSHSGARPKCASFQGRIYSKSGEHPKYPSFSVTTYGQPDGLFGINCRHIKYPYIEGISRRTYKPYNYEKNKKAYEESQKQRYLERQIRQAKRELNMMEELGDKKGVEKAKKLVRARQANMRAFILNTSRTRMYEREKPY